MAEICLIGLFGLSGAFGPLVITFALIIFTFLVQISLDAALSPLLHNLPRTLTVEEELRRAGHNGLEFEEGDALEVEEPDQNPYDSDFDPGAPDMGPIHSLETTDRGIRDIQGKSAAAKITGKGIGAYARIKFAKSPLPAFISRVDFWSVWITPDPSITNPNFLLKWLHPEIFADHGVLRMALPKTLDDGEVASIDEVRWPQIVYEEGVVKEAFCPPSIRSRAPKLRIPKDVAGVSAQEVRHTGKVIPISDEGVAILRNGVLNVDVQRDWREEWEKARF
jgi:hypothetical protein